MDQNTCNFMRKITHKAVINIVKQSILWMKYRWLNNKSLCDMGKFTLHFKEPLIPQQLLRSGGQHEPLERELRTESEDQYEEAMSDPSKKVSYSYDFCVHHMTGNIIPTLSTGLSTYTDEREFSSDYEKALERLWKLDQKTNYYETQITQTYPLEMEVHPDKNNKNHFGIRPAEYVILKPEKFRQMLRCLPWVKIYTYGDVKKAKEKEAKEKKKAKEKQKHN